MNKSYHWQKSETAALKKLQKSGHTARQISEKLGRSVNSIIGKMDRLGLLKKTITTNPNRIKMRKAVKKVRYGDVLFSDATNKQCMFMGGSMKQTSDYVCGKPVHKGPWCEECHKKVYQ